MNPAFSVVFFTTLAGAGQGLFLALFASELLAPGLAPARWLALGGLVCLVWCALGLVASFFHLGRPERAWRAAAMWRTSWLSREVIALPTFMGLVLLWVLGHAGLALPTRALGAAAALAALALFLCTAMIYMVIRFVQEWATPLTLLNFSLLGLASGACLAALLAAVGAPTLQAPFALAALVFTLLGAAVRVGMLVRNAQLKPRSTLQTAIGIRHPQIAQRSQGFMGPSFNTREFFHGKSAAVLRQLKWAFLALGFVLPALMLRVSLEGASALWLGLTFAVQMAGLLIERWFFFAQARHPQNLYYQAVS